MSTPSKKTKRTTSSSQVDESDKHPKTDSGANTGKILKIPSIGLGSASPGDLEVFEKAVIYAIEEVGYRYIDTAELYGSEEIIGKALAKIFEKGVIKREDIWVTTKLWCTNRRPERVEPTIRNSLKRLGLDYVDLYLVHWPVAFVPQADGSFFPKGADGAPLLDTTVDILDTWEAMERLVALNLTRFIGVSNFSIEMLERMELSPRLKIKPYAIQVELTLYLQQAALIEYCESREIQVTSYFPFCRFQPCKTWGTSVLDDPAVTQVATETGKTHAQVVLRFLLQLSPVVNVIPKSSTPSRLLENFQLDFTLTPAQVELLKKRNVNDRWGDFPQKEFGYDVFGIGIGYSK